MVGQPFGLLLIDKPAAVVSTTPELLVLTQLVLNTFAFSKLSRNSVVLALALSDAVLAANSVKASTNITFCGKYLMV